MSKTEWEETVAKHDEERRLQLAAAKEALDSEPVRTPNEIATAIDRVANALFLIAKIWIACLIIGGLLVLISFAFAAEQMG